MKHKKSILHLFSGDLWAGAEVLIFNLISALLKNDDVKIICISLNEGVLVNKLKELGIEVHVISEEDNRFFSLVSIAKDMLKNENIDVIHSHRYKENFLAYFLARYLSVSTLVSTVHGVVETANNENNFKSKIREYLNYYILKYKFRFVVAVSKEIHEFLLTKKKFNKINLKVIRNGIPVWENVPLPIKKESIHIGIVARLVPVKNLMLFLQLANSITQKYENVYFSILGEGEEKNKLLHAACQLGVKDKVSFIDSTPSPYDFYKSLDIYVNTSFHEGIPLSILEAMSFGLIVMAPDIGGIPEIIDDGENGILVKVNNLSDYAKKCENIIQNLDKMDNIRTSARRKVIEKFSAQKMANDYSRLYMSA